MVEVGRELAFLLEAATLAADRHRNQRRKGVDAVPYINHPLGVAALLARVGGVTDVETLAAAILHDTIEDTRTTADELEAKFGQVVRRLVEEVTDDKSLDKAVRKRLQIEHAPDLSHGAKLIKLGDMSCNVGDIIDNPPKDWPLARQREYLDWAERVVAGCRGANGALERHFDEQLQRGRRRLPREA
ncbi:MAG: HD domain-containing protein [Chloroflexota bacterium]